MSQLWGKEVWRDRDGALLATEDLIRILQVIGGTHKVRNVCEANLQWRRELSV